MKVLWLQSLLTLKSLKINFEEKVTKIKAVDDDIFELINDQDELEKEMMDALHANDIYYDTISKIEVHLKKTLSPHSSPSSSPSVTRRVEEKVKLPKIELQKFDGDFMAWQTFWDQYESTVHKQAHLSNIDKFTYLKSLLNSNASECIAGLALTNENYNEAILLLKERFGNKQLLINAYINSFIKLQGIKSMNQVKELRFIYDQLETTVRNLKSLEVETETYGCFLVPILTQKLPNELKMIMARNF